MISVLVVVVGGEEGKLQTEGRPGLAGLSGAWSLVQEFGAVFAGRAVIDRAVRTDEVVPGNWTGRIVKSKPEKRSTCPRNAVSTVPI